VAQVFLEQFQVAVVEQGLLPLVVLHQVELVELVDLAAAVVAVVMVSAAQGFFTFSIRSKL